MILKGVKSRHTSTAIYTLYKNVFNFIFRIPYTDIYSAVFQHPTKSKDDTCVESLC